MNSCSSGSLWLSGWASSATTLPARTPPSRFRSMAVTPVESRFAIGSI
nr:hypothetical protein [Halostella litorea]